MAETTPISPDEVFRQNLQTEILAALSIHLVEPDSTNEAHMEAAAFLDRETSDEAGEPTQIMVNPITDEHGPMTNEELREWVAGELGPLWLVQNRDTDRQFSGFVFQYEDEQLDQLNQKLGNEKLSEVAHQEMNLFVHPDRLPAHMSHLDKEAAAFDLETQTLVLGLIQVFSKPEISSVAIYTTDPDQAEINQLTEVGGVNLGVIDYSDGEKANGFLIRREAWEQRIPEIHRRIVAPQPPIPPAST